MKKFYRIRVNLSKLIHPRTVFLLQVFILIFFNLTQLKYHVDYDSSTIYDYSVKIWEQKSLYLDNWYFQTTAQLDSPAIIAALLYGITKNIFLSYGIANIFLSTVFFLCVLLIFKHFEISDIQQWIVMNLVSGLYIGIYMVQNSLGYGDLLYIGGGWYSVRIIYSLLLLLGVFQILDGERKKWVFICTLFLSFLTGLSSGNVILITVLLPIFFWAMLDKFVISVSKASNLKYILVFLISNMMFTAIGKRVGLTFFKNIQSFESGIQLIGISKIVENMFAILQGFLDLLSALPADSNPPGQSGGVVAMSFVGFSFGLRFIAFILFITALLACIKHKWFKNNSKMQIILTCIGMNLAILGLLDTRYGSRFFESRYLLLTYIMGLFIVGYYLNKTSILGKRYVVVGATLLLLVFHIAPAYEYYQSRNNYDELKIIADKIREYDVPVVFVFGDSMAGASRNLRVVDTSVEYRLVTNSMKPHGWGETKKYNDIGEYDGKILLLTNKESEEILPAYIKNNATITDIGLEGYKLFLLKNNIIDLETGVQFDKTSATDIIFSSGMILNDDGEDKTDFILENKLDVGKYVLFGPYAVFPEGKYDFTLVFNSISSEGGFFDIAAQEGKLQLASSKIQIDKKTTEVRRVVVDSFTGPLEYRVFLPPKSNIEIESIRIRKVE